MKNIDKVKHGDWIFTCSMKPLQFDSFEPRDPKHYDQAGLSMLTEEEYSNWMYDDFKTMEGSSHSIKNCGCKVITEKYAKWFLDNNIAGIIEQYKQEGVGVDWEAYEQAVKELCLKDGIEYEGV
jgi:hypothetical protein